MKEKVTYINEEYFCYTNEDSRIIVIFKKVKQVPRGQNVDAATVIELNAKKNGLNVPCSKLLSGIDNPILLEVLKETLFVYVANQGKYISQYIQPIFAHNKIELTINRVVIAKITLDTKKRKAKLFLLFAILVVGLVFFLGRRRNDTSVVDNADQYQADSLKIGKIERAYNEAINSNNPYVEYLSPALSKAINEYVKEIKKKAYTNYCNAKNGGEYRLLTINEDSIKQEISRLVVNAKNNKIKCETRQKEKRAKVYNDNLKLINRLQEYIKEEEGRCQKYLMYLDKRELRKISDSLLVLKTQMLEQKGGFEDNDIPFIVKYNAYRKSIARLFERARECYASAQHKSKMSKTKDSKRDDTPPVIRKGRKREHEKRTKTNKDMNVSNATLQLYKKWVAQANQDYKTFYFSNKKDKGAARRAIVKYQKAQEIKYDSGINARINKLESELK